MPDPLHNRPIVEQSIYLIRKHKVMLDEDLAKLYGVETGALVRAVQRNIERFPLDFMFQLSEQELTCLRCQVDISKTGRGGRSYILWTNPFKALKVPDHCTVTKVNNGQYVCCNKAMADLYGGVDFINPRSALLPDWPDNLRICTLSEP